MVESIRKSRVLVLDFDGVISDSAPECFEVALRAYREMERDPLLSCDRKTLYSGFLALMPWGNRAEDFGVALKMIDFGKPARHQEDYDTFRARLGTEWHQAFHGEFYRQREKFREEDPGQWWRLIQPYPQWIQFLGEIRSAIRMAIATSKDRASVELILGHFGMDSWFGSDWIEDKETGADKSVHLRCIQERAQVQASEMYFIDDKLSHLDAVSALGVQCGLATWGYNGPLERKLAEERGYDICELPG